MSLTQAASPASIRARVILGRALSPARTLPAGPSLIIFIVVFLGIFGPFITPHDPVKHHLTAVLDPPLWQNGGDPSFPLGTDQLGRDILSRLIGGARISLVVGLTAVFAAGSIGCALALLAGYFGGWVDVMIMRLTDIMLSMPFLMVAIALAAVLGPGLKNIILILAIMGWASYTRVLRGDVLRIRRIDFVSLAVVAGCTRPRILLRHIFPNVLNTLVVLATLQLGATIIAEAALSFLGLGIPPPAPSWGSMLASGRQYISEAWWMATFPGLAIMFTVLGTNLLGDWLRDRLDPKLRQV